MFTPVGLKTGHTLLSLLQRVCQVPVLCTGIFLLGFAGCSPRYDDMPAYWPIPNKDYDNYGPGRFKTSLLAAQIDRHYRGSAPGPIGVTTFVNVDDLHSSSTFGRMVGEQLMSELAMKGFDVIELRHTDALQFLDRGGEFALSRDVGMVRPERNLAGVVVGTYVASPERVYVNARLIDPSTSVVLSAGSVEMSKTPELTKLLRGGSLPGSLERIPVRHLGNTTQQIDPTETARRRWSQEEGGWDIPQVQPGPSVPSASLPSTAVAPKGAVTAPRVVSQPDGGMKDESVGPAVRVQ
jgi:TolB-like protein